MIPANATDPSNPNPDPEVITYASSATVRFSGVHIGKGLWLGANHNPNAGPTFTVTPQRGLVTQGEAHQTTEVDYTLPEDTSLWPDYTSDYNVYIGYDQALHFGEALSSTMLPYDGPAAPMLIASDPDDLAGDAVVVGYPSQTALDTELGGGTFGELWADKAATLEAGRHTEIDVNGDAGGYFTVFGEAVGGMSGGGTFLSYDPDGDNVFDYYLIATNSAIGTVGTGPLARDAVFSTSIAPHYGDLGDAITGWGGPNPRIADDFNRMVLLSGQSSGSSFVTVDGQFFHEDIYGGVNADTLYGGGGDDSIFGGDGDDTINAGSGDDVLTGGAGAEFYGTRSFGGGATDTITDFSQADGDILDLGLFFNSLAEVQAASSETGGNLIIDLGAEGQVILEGVTWTDVENQVVLTCFAADTLVETPAGPRPISEIEIGDEVMTPDGPAPVRHVLRRDFTRDMLSGLPRFWPVTFAAGALGPNCPSAPVTVSPQHRVLVDSPVTARMSGGPVLVAAKKLLGRPGVSQSAPEQDFSYIHLVLAGHAILRTHDMWSESFYPGPQAMLGQDGAQRAELAAIFGEEAMEQGVPFAQPVVTRKRLQRLLMRHDKNGHPLQCA